MSPIISVDASEAVSSKPIDPGVYEFEVESVSDAKSGAKAMYVTTIFVCQDEPFVGRKVYHNTPISGKGAGMFLDMAAKILDTTIDVDDIEDMDIDTDDLVGESVMCTITHREYNGEMQHEIKKISRM